MVIRISDKTQNYSKVTKLLVKPCFNSCIEIFLDGTKSVGEGCIRHFAFATDHVDEIVERVHNAGYKVSVEPIDVVMKTDPVFPIRVAFIEGPLHESIELFWEKA